MTKIYFTKNDVIKESNEGFSWAVLLFGALVPLFKGDLKNTLILIILAFLLPFIGNVLFAFVYNQMYNNDLIADGWKRCDENGKLLKTIKNNKNDNN